MHMHSHSRLRWCSQWHILWGAQDGQGPRRVDARAPDAQDNEGDQAYCRVDEDGHKGAAQRRQGGGIGAGVSEVGMAKGAAGAVVAAGADSRVGALVLVAAGCRL